MLVLGKEAESHKSPSVCPTVECLPTLPEETLKRKEAAIIRA